MPGAIWSCKVKNIIDRSEGKTLKEKLELRRPTGR